MLVIQAISQKESFLASDELPLISNPKQRPTQNHNRRRRRLPRTRSSSTNRRTPTRTSRRSNANCSRLNHSLIPHPNIPSIRHSILRRRFSRLTRILRDRIETDRRRARRLRRRDDYVGRDVRADAAVGFAAVALRHVDYARAADEFAVDVPLEGGDGADVEVGGWGRGRCG